MAEHLPIALLFPGQGSQQRRMAAGLYDHDPVFTDAVDTVFDAMRDAGAELRRDWLAAEPALSVDHVLRSTPLLFTVGYGLAAMVHSWGVRPAALLGHSIGEMAAATYAGVFPLAEAARLVADRVRLLATAPAGGMLAVAARPEQLAPYLDGDVVVGAVNAVNQTVLAGTQLPLRQAARRLRADGFVCRPVPALSPFHSPAMAHFAPIEEPLFATVPLAAPSVPIYSGYTGRLLEEEKARDPGFWAGHPAQPVLFWPALTALLSAEDHRLVELGPGEALSTLVRRHPAVAAGRSRVLAALPLRSSRDDDRAAVERLRDALGAAVATPIVLAT